MGRELNRPANEGKIESLKRVLPDFENPPAVETYLGVHFHPLENWKIPHFGLFWNHIKREYPKVEVRPALISGEVPSFELAIGGPQAEMNPPVRCWFINQSETRLIQVQNNLFIHNWRRPAGGDEQYSHYDDLRPIFEEEWRRFTDFLAEQAIGKVNVTMCEATYINHLDRGVGWESFADIPEVFPCWSGLTSGSFLPPPQTAAIRAFYRMKQPEGQLEIAAQPAIRQTDAREIIQLNVTGRCKPASSDQRDILLSLDAAREWVVRGFTDFTSTKMHEVWRRTV